MSRSYSDKFLSGSSDYDLFKNKNVDWMSAPFVKIVYIGVILFAWGVIHISTFFSAEDCWTVTNMAHGVVRTQPYIWFLSDSLQMLTLYFYLYI